MAIGTFLLSMNLEFIREFSGDATTVVYAQNFRKSSWKQKEIIVTTWNSIEPDSSIYPKIAGEKYNLVLVDNLVENLNIADKDGLKAMFKHKLLKPASLHDPIERKKLDNLIDTVKKYPALEAYFIEDEPSATKFSDYGELFAYLHKKDPARLAYINLFPTYANQTQLGISENQVDKTKIKYPTYLHGIGSNNKTVLLYLEHLRQFITVVKPDLISYDHYHLWKDRDSEQYFLNLALISQASKEANIPFMNVIQAGRFEKEWRIPTAAEMRFQVYTTLAYGGKGISYFTYWGGKAEEGLYREGKPSPLVKDVAIINAEIRKLSPALMSLDFQSVYHTGLLPLGGEKMPKNAGVKVVSNGEFVVGLFGKGQKTTAFTIVNRNYKQKQTAEVKLNLSGRKLQELDRKTGKWVQKVNLITTRKIKLMLEPGDGRLFRAI
jgi:hypothetical protein